MENRVTADASPEISQPSVIKAICILNFAFMVDVLDYFTRNDLEKIQMTCAWINQLVKDHFKLMPLRLLDNAKLNFNLDGSMQLSLSKPTMNGQFPMICWDPCRRCWIRTGVHNVAFSQMLPCLNKIVRVPKVYVWISDDTNLKQGNIAKVKSLSHIWENAQVEFSTVSEEENLTLRAKLLSEAKLICCRRFKYSCKSIMLPLWDYPEIYSMEAVEVNFPSTIFDPLSIMENGMTSITQLIENQALYTHSPTIFVFSEDKYTFVSLITNNIIELIRNKFMDSDKVQSFQVIFAIKIVGEKLSDGEMGEFRLQNNSTREVLQLRLVTFDEVAKYCEFDAHTKYFVLVRSNV
ncbi:hypothetical protein Ddc_15474 [Ditylenchus destructor]|nr:hypothetical protein Ddc_15474 [Ditylenchus destructor]